MLHSLPTSYDNVCLITDFMCYIHIPPPSTTVTYSEYFNYLLTIATTHSAGNTTSIVFVFDKPEHLPPPRTLVHEKRAKGKSTPYNFEKLINLPVPQGKEYASLLTVHEYKCKIVQYISNKLVSTCIEE